MTLYVLDYPFCCNWWNFILCNSWVIILLKIYKPALLLIKYPCSTRDLGPLRPSFCLPSCRSMETYWVHFLARAFKTYLRGCPVPSWVVQILCMGFIGFPHNPRDTALSLFLSFFSSTLVLRSQSVKDCSMGYIIAIYYSYSPVQCLWSFTLYQSTGLDPANLDILSILTKFWIFLVPFNI